MMNVRPFVCLVVFLSCVGTWANRTFAKTSRTQKHPNLYWNTTNPIFRIDNTDHIIDVNQGTLPHEYDQINIICPSYSKLVPEQDTERYVIYSVDKEEFDTCRILNPHPRILAKCDDPYRERFFTISFRSFSPMPGMLEFKAGQDYYFISTSSKEDIYRRIHGDCMNHNMKVVFKIADKTKKFYSPTTARTNNRVDIPTTAPTTLQIFTTGLEGRKVNRPLNYTTYFINSEINKEKVIVLNDTPGEHESLVKKVRDKIKQEASTKISNSSCSHKIGLFALLLLVSIS